MIPTDLSALGRTIEEPSGGSTSEQLLYEVHDPSAYLTPDVTADFSGVRFTAEGSDRVRVTAATGRHAPDALKVTIGYRDGFIGETQLSCGGSGCLTRARRAADVLLAEVAATGIRSREARADLIGVNSLYGEALPIASEPPEVRVRLAVRTPSREEAELVAGLADGLTLAGPAGGGGPTMSVREVIAVATVYIPRGAVHPEVAILET